MPASSTPSSQCRQAFSQFRRCPRGVLFSIFASPSVESKATAGFLRYSNRVGNNFRDGGIRSSQSSFGVVRVKAPEERTVRGGWSPGEGTMRWRTTGRRRTRAA